MAHFCAFETSTQKHSSSISAIYLMMTSIGNRVGRIKVQQLYIEFNHYFKGP